MNNITKALAYLFVIFFLLAVGGYTFSKQQTPNTEVKEEKQVENPPVVDYEAIFVSDIKNIYNQAQKTWLNDTMTETGDIVYCNVEGCERSIESVPANYSYYILINPNGSIAKYYVVDGTYQFAYTGNELLLENITNGRKISELYPNEVITVMPNM